MTRYQCITCKTVHAADENEPDACGTCGGPIFDLDHYEARRAEARIIGAQNDAFRTALGPVTWQGQSLHGRVVVTRGICALGPSFLHAALAHVRADTAFMDDHGTDGARSFGMLDVAHEGGAVRIYWKIDLYDTDGLMGPEVESDPAQTIRVLTLCLPEEY
ncbi:MAG: DUF3768 domain-containing protein [Paracoccus sp. (in: a-proteobacteria)]|uniref:DUF3768 domain-containing protein n=1 Tax=Paracoccus sp. TaxID=267 RepID=UPI0040580F26